MPLENEELQELKAALKAAVHAHPDLTLLSPEDCLHSGLPEKRRSFWITFHGAIAKIRIS